jgi:hypothetical protein
MSQPGSRPPPAEVNPPDFRLHAHGVAQAGALAIAIPKDVNNQPDQPRLFVYIPPGAFKNDGLFTVKPCDGPDDVFQWVELDYVMDKVVHLIDSDHEPSKRMVQFMVSKWKILSDWVHLTANLEGHHEFICHSCLKYFLFKV